MKRAVRYATVEVVPYPHLGEFVIVGVIAISEGRRIAHRLLDARKTTRLTQFFPEIDRKVFTEGLRALHDELDRLAIDINGQENIEAALQLEGNDGNAIFQILTSAREGMLRIRERGVAMTSDMESWIDDAFKRFVFRTNEETATEVAEIALTSQVRGLLKQWKLNKLYQQSRVGEEHYHALFPFAYTPEGEKLPTRVIKPLYLAQDSPTRILDHGDTWLQKIRRLRQFNYLPDQIVFPVQLPKSLPEHQEAADFLITDFKKEGIDIVTNDDVTKLRKLVNIDLAGTTGLFS